MSKRLDSRLDAVNLTKQKGESQMKINKNEILNRIKKLQQKGLSYANISSKLNDEGLKTSTGRKIDTRYIGYVLHQARKSTRKTINSKPYQGLKTKPDSFINHVLTNSVMDDSKKIQVLKAYLL